MKTNWYKKARQDQPIISFDFDDTIFSLAWSNEENDYERDEDGNAIGTLNEKIQYVMNRYAGMGCKIIIVSTRKNSTKHEIENFVREHNLPVSEIHCTDSQDKLNTLKTLGVLKHFDDDQHEIDMINEDASLVGILV